MEDSTLESLDFVAFSSGIMSALAVVGPWAQSSDSNGRMTLTVQLSRVRNDRHRGEKSECAPRCDGRSNFCLAATTGGAARHTLRQPVQDLDRQIDY